MKISSNLTSLAKIVDESPVWNFNIPIYQRLYVWGEDQVLTLLNDLANAYERGADLFFLGGTLLVEQEGTSGRHFDLIDGQQRFTTLWLLCQVWRDSLKPFLTAKSGDRNEPRLRFAIRPEVNRFLEDLAFGPGGKSAAGEEVTLRMRTAMDLMDSLFERRPLTSKLAGISVTFLCFVLVIGRSTPVNLVASGRALLSLSHGPITPNIAMPPSDA